MYLTGLFDNFRRKEILKRFHFKNQVLNNISAIVPWISVFLIICMFLSLEKRIATQAGVKINVPQMPVTDNVKPDMMALIVKLDDVPYGKDGKEAIFFDDERFLIGNTMHLQKLKERLREKTSVNAESILLLMTDGNVSYATTVKILRLANEAGVRHILFSAE